MTPQERKVIELAFEALKENQHLVADNQRHAYVMEYNSIIEKCEEALAKTEQEPAAWEQFYPDIGKPQLKQLPQLSQEVVLQYPKEAVDWQKQQKEYAQQLKVEGPCHVVCQCDKCKAQEQDNAYIYASNLAKTIWQKHYMKESPKFALLDTTEGVLTQIDNMTCGLVREKPAQPEQEPVAYIRVSKTGNVMACAKTGDFYKLPDKTLLYTSPQPAPVQEPVAWHKGDSVYWHTSPDLNDWIRANGEPLYTNPPPCPTCEALARTVMLDQTSHDAQRKPLTDEEVEKIIKSNMSLQMNLAGIRADIEAAHGIKE